MTTEIAPRAPTGDALMDATQGAVEFAGRLADLVNNIGPALAEIERLGGILASFDDAHDTSMEPILDPIRELVGARLHRAATVFDEGVGEDAIYHRKRGEGADLEAVMADLEAEDAP